MKKIFYVICLLFLLILPIKVCATNSLVNYQAHVSDIGWQEEVSDGLTAGTTGQSKSVEALKIKLNNIDGNIVYQTYDRKNGWQDEVSDGNTAGSTGKSLYIEAIKIRLSGSVSSLYDVYYRVHVQNIGWMGWSKNGEKAGSTGYNYRMEAIEIKLVNKDSSAPGATENNYQEKISVNYKSHVSDIGWQEEVSDGNVSGTIGKSKKIEAIKINLLNKTYSGNVVYSSYVQNIGWQSEVSNGNLVGTTGQSKRIEAVKIKLTDEYQEKYDIYYRVHVQNIGWMGWSKNGEKAGTIGYNYRIEAIEIKLQKKNDPAPDNTNSYLEKESKMTYQAHVQTEGWMDYVNNSETAGTTGKSLRMEAFRIKFSNETDTNFISYKSHVQDIGWMNWENGNNISGTVGKSKKIEAIQIKLTGELAEKYDVYYRTHVSTVGWLDWTKNGEKSGTTGQGLSVEAYQVKLVLKGSAAPGATETPYREAQWVTDSNGNKYFYNVYGNLVTNSITINDTTYYFGPTGVYLGTGKLKVIDVSHHQGNIDWAKVASSGIYGVILRIGYWKTEDSKFNSYIADVKKYNIPYGIYIFSYASTANGANIEANFTNSMISKYSLNPTLGIFYDLEDWYTSSETSDTISKDQYDVISRTYINSVSSYVNNRYKVKVYADLNHTNNKFGSYTRSQVDWLAQYGPKCTYTGKYSMWQFSSEQRIPGINGNVDMSYLYR